MKKGIPTASPVHNSGTATSKTGAFIELQLNARIAATGINHNNAKSAKSASWEKPRKSNISKQIKNGMRTGRLTMSIKPKSQRENPKPPGLTK